MHSLLPVGDEFSLFLNQEHQWYVFRNKFAERFGGVLSNTKVSEVSASKRFSIDVSPQIFARLLDRDAFRREDGSSVARVRVSTR